MDNIILGLLLLDDRTIYQLRERINKGMHLMYSGSMGSIQAAIKKLLNNGYIRYEESTENGRYRKTYSITDSGKRHFFEWIDSPIETQNTKNPELVKIYFMGFADKDSRKANIEKYLSILTKQYHMLSAICEEGDHIKVMGKQQDIVFYQLAAARYGRDFMKFNIDWYRSFINEMEDESLWNSSN